MFNLWHHRHHPVLKVFSLTTKLRVVFDALIESSIGVALNDVRICGSALQEEIFYISVRIRNHQYFITADVKKMFWQVAVAIENQDLQRIVWRAMPNDTIYNYRLITFTYNTKSASCMKTKCLAFSKISEKPVPESFNSNRELFLSG